MVKIGKRGVISVWFLTVAVVLAACILMLTSPLSSRAATEKEKVDAATENVMLDADGEKVKITYYTAADAEVKTATVAADNNPAVFANNDGSTKMMSTQNIGNGGKIVIDLDKRYKASLFSSVKVRLVAGNWDTGNVVTTAYAANDAAFIMPAGAVSTGYGNKEAMLECEAWVLSADGYIDSIVLTVARNADTKGQFFFDYVELTLATPKESVDTATEDILVDMDDTLLHITCTGKDGNCAHADSLASLFGSDVSESKKVIFTPALANGSDIRIYLHKKYKAELFDSVNIRMVVGQGGKTTIYSADKTLVASVTTTKDNEAVTVRCDPAKLAVDGYIDTIVLRRTEGTNNAQHFFNYVQFELPAPPVEKDKVDTAEDDITLDADGVQAKIIHGGKDATVGADNANAAGNNGIFKDTDGSTKSSWTGAVSNGDTIVIDLDKKYKADLFEKVQIRMVPQSWNAGETVTTRAYAANDTTHANAAGESVTGASGHPDVILLCDPAKLTVDGYIDSIVLTVTRTEGKTGQFFFDYVELVLPAPPVEKVKVDTAEEDISLDADGEKVKAQYYVTADGAGKSASAGGDAFNVFGEGKDNTVLVTQGIGNGGKIVIDLDKKYNADLFEKVKVRIAVGNGGQNTGNVITTAYASNDTAFAMAAGATTTAYGDAVQATLECDAQKLAVDGYIDSIVLTVTRTEGQTGQYFFDYVQLCLPAPPVEKEKVDTTDGNIALDADGEKVKAQYYTAADAVAQDAKVVADNDPAVFAGNDGSTKMMFTQGIGNGGKLIIDLDKKYKADLFTTVKIRMAVGNWTENAKVTACAYASDDTAFAKAAGTVTTGYGNVEVLFECDAQKLAVDGYIDSIVLTVARTAGSGRLPKRRRSKPVRMRSPTCRATRSA